MEIFPIWRTANFPTEESEAVFRIMKWGTQEIYRGRGRRYPGEEYLTINLNKPTQNTIDSMIYEALGESGDTVAASNAYAEFSLQFYSESNDTWITVYEFAMINDWSYEYHEGNIYSDPINGHACPGMVLPYSYLVTGDTAETICYEEVEFDMPYIIITPATLVFNDTGGTLTFEVNSNCYWKLISGPGIFNLSQTEGTSGITTVTITASQNEGYNDLIADYKFRGRNEYGIATATLHVTQEGTEPYLNITSGDGAIFNGHRANWTLTYNTNVRPAYYELTGTSGYFATGYTNGGTVTVSVPGSLSGDSYEIKFYTEPNGIFLDSANATQQESGEYFDILSGNGATFSNSGGTWTVTYDTNIPNVYYEYYDCHTWRSGYTSGYELNITIASSSTECNHIVNFYNEPNGVLIGTATASQGDSKMYFYFSVLTGGYIYNERGYYKYPDLWYSFDNGNTWSNEWPHTTQCGCRYFAVNAGDTVFMKGNTIADTTELVRFIDRCGDHTARYNVGGNIMSLYYGDNFEGKTEIPQNAFNGKRYIGNMFGVDTQAYGVVDASNLVLPMTLTEGCLSAMFMNMKTLVAGPKLPWTTMERYCYSDMFNGCTALVTAPALPATALTNATGCYSNMFAGCTSLTAAPVLPATTLTGANGCYSGMFAGCTSLVNAPALPSTLLEASCYESMFAGCTALVNAPALPATDLIVHYSDPYRSYDYDAEYCYKNMFNGCTSLVNAPALPATTLASNCYYGMFNGCTSLTTAPALPATTAVSNCYENMFKGCTALVNAPALPSMTLANYCYDSMFENCTSLTTAPVLPATSFSSVLYCYKEMFQGCTNLNYVKCLLEWDRTQDIYNITFNWLMGVSQTGTFVKASGTTWPTRENGIPTGWTVIDN